MVPLKKKKKKKKKPTELYREPTKLFLFLVFIDARLTYKSQNIRASSQVFHVPPSRSGDAGIRAEDQHRFIVPEQCQPPAPHDGLTLRPRQYIQRKKVIKNPNVCPASSRTWSIRSHLAGS